MNITDLRAADTVAIEQVAALLVELFPESWPDRVSAVDEVRESFGPERISRVAVDDAAGVVGWIGGIRQYDGHVWELHPLVVQPRQQGQGIGSALVADLEEQVRERQGITVWLGSDDDTGQTSLGYVDLYPNVYQHIAAIKNLARHPYEFYQKQGYVITGVMPDANGLGKPDIYMAKRVAQSS